jgi:hypothetical protein
MMPSVDGRDGSRSRRDPHADTRVTALSATRNGTGVTRLPGGWAQQPKQGGLTTLMDAVEQLLSGATNRRHRLLEHPKRVA